MKAWQLLEYGAPLVLREVEVPVAGPGEVVVEVRAAGLCHGDIGAMAGDLAVLNPTLPFTLGHEVAGVVVEVGEGVITPRVGQRVAFPGAIDGPGIGRDGGYAERVVARAEGWVEIPDGLDFSFAALAMDAGMTALHALRVGGVGAGTRLGIIGLGGLGSLAAQMAIALGAEVYAAEIKEDVWPRALEWGVAKCATDIAEFKDLDLSVIVDYAGYGTTTVAALETVAHGGRVVQVGAVIKQITISAFTLASNELSLVGARGGSHEDCRDVLAFMAAGQITPIVTPIGFEEIGEGLARFERGEVRGRLVAVRDPDTL